MANFTEKAIKETFIKMINDKPISQITVKALAQECGINRNSFYYHFNDIPSLIESIVMDEAQKVIEQNKTIDSVAQCFDMAVEFCLDNKRAALHIFNSVNRDIFETYLMQVCRHVVSAYIDTVTNGKPIKENDKEIITRSLTYGCFGAIIFWLSGGMKENVTGNFHRLHELTRDLPQSIIERSMEG